MRAIAVCAVMLTLLAASTRGDEPALPLLLREDFNDGASRWKPTDASAWQIERDGDENIYRLKKQSDYRPPHRSPVNIALLQDLHVSDFTLDARVRSTSREYGHRDLCLFFGYQDPAHFYYVHLGRKADDHANQIFIVNDAARAKISTTSNPGTPWTDSWHQVRVTRNAESGEIAVYFDDLEKPAMTAQDKTFAVGRIGIGSFDDTGDFDDIRLHGKRAVKPAMP